jgi:hypothetical protein
MSAPCPFCGNEKCTTGFFGTFLAVVCPECDAQGPFAISAEDAEIQWSVRVSE